MTKPSAEVLMITYNRAAYTRLSLRRLLDTCPDDAGIWVWHNGSHAETLDVVKSFEGHPRLTRVHVSAENVGITEPTNWFWRESSAPLIGKVDDDCLVSPGWLETLSAAHAANAGFGVVACWHYRPSDYDPELAGPKIREFDGGHALLLNFWTGGSGYLMKRTCVDKNGEIRPGQGFSAYCISLALAGWVNGWYIPLILQDHMDDPRSEHTLLKSDDDLARFAPLSAQTNQVATLQEWEDQHRRSARIIQTASIDPRDYRGLRQLTARMKKRVRRSVSGRQW